MEIEPFAVYAVNQRDMSLRLSCLVLPAVLCAQSPTAFDVASVKPNTSVTTSMKFPVPSGGRFTATNVTLKTLISYAWNLSGVPIYGGPSWLASDKYDVDARAANSDLSPIKYRSMLQALLAERFQVIIHRETRDLPAYVLSTEKNGPKLTPADPAACAAAHTCGTFFTGPSSLDAHKMSFAQLANTLAIVVGRPVIDNTRISGTYYFHLEFTHEGTNIPVLRDASGVPPDPVNPDAPPLANALERQLGLKLESHKEPVEVLVIDRAERPSAN
jgi:uncharacterized protein (TIGR03435 family)